VSWQRLPEGTEPGDLVGDVPMVGGHADPADVLLWLYGRQRHLYVDEGVGDTALLDRFRALTFTD
jgi:hypothetical protein